MLPRNHQNLNRNDACPSIWEMYFDHAAWERQDKRLLFMGFLSNKLRIGPFFLSDWGNRRKNVHHRRREGSKPNKNIEQYVRIFRISFPFYAAPSTSITILVSRNECGLGVISLPQRPIPDSELEEWRGRCYKCFIDGKQSRTLPSAKGHCISACMQSEEDFIFVKHSHKCHWPLMME